jgi:hypothetical protein
MNPERHLTVIVLLMLVIFSMPNRLNAAPQTEHPRLLFVSSDLQQIREKIKSGFPQSVWNSMLAVCAKLLN